MRIGELAARAGVPPRTIRFYEKSGILPLPARTPGGYRQYDDSAPARLQFVRSGQALGLSLAEIAEILTIREQQGPPCDHVRELLTRHVCDLDRRIHELTALRDELHRRLRPGNRLDPEQCATTAICYLIE